MTVLEVLRSIPARLACALTGHRAPYDPDLYDGVSHATVNLIHAGRWCRFVDGREVGCCPRCGKCLRPGRRAWGADVRF